MKKLINKIQNYHPSKITTLLFFFIPIMVSFTIALRLDNDFWFLSNTGKYIINNGFPTTEIFTIHEGFAFIPQQWLCCVMFYLIYKYLGGTGIVILTMIMFFIINYLMYKLCMLVSDNKHNLSVLLTVIMTTLLSFIFIRSRPQIFDFAIFLLMFYMLELYTRKKNIKYLFVLPVLSLIMINIHASSFFLLFIFILPYLINSFKFNILCFESEGYRKSPLFITIIIMLLTGFINPYGIKAMSYIFTSYNSFYINNIVSEMRHPIITQPIGALIYITIFAILLTYLFVKNKNIKIRYFLLLIGTIYLTLSHLKGYSYLLITSIFPLADYLKDYFIKDENRYHYNKEYKIKYCIIVMVMVSMIGIIYKCTKEAYEQNWVTQIVDYMINELKVSNKAKVYTDYDVGAYVEYRGLRVYIDPRAEVFLKSNNKKEDIAKEFYLLQHFKLDEEKFIKKYDFDYIIVCENDILYINYLDTKKNNKYKKIYRQKTEESNYYLYEKNK